MIGLLLDAIDMLEAKLEYKEELYRQKKDKLREYKRTEGGEE